MPSGVPSGSARTCSPSSPDEARYRTDLVTSAANLSSVLSASGRHEEAEKSIREIIATCEAAAASRSPRSIAGNSSSP